MYTKRPYPGKFEGNHSQLVAQAVYNRILNGFSDADCGDVNELGWCASLVTTDKHTYICYEDSQGFVDVWMYTDKKEAEKAWKELEDNEEYHREMGSYDPCDI